MEVDPARAGIAAGSRHPYHRLGELFAVLAAPLAAYLVLRIAIFAQPGLDASSHTTYIVNPRAMFSRYQTALVATGRMREGARVGLLVPARLAYLAFGAVPGFVVLRYLLALVAIGPAYLLLKRLYGVGAGALAVAVILSCPVLLLVWGSDYPDASEVSFLLAMFACVGLSLVATSRGGHRCWMGAAGAMFAMATWSLAQAGLYGAGALAVYGGLRLWRERSGLVVEAIVFLGAALAVSGLLAVASYFELGQLNYFTTTWVSLRYLSTPAQKLVWHSRSWRWLPYDTYLLVPPTLLAMFVAMFWRKLRSLPSAVLFIGSAAAVQVGLAVWLQFADGVEALEAGVWSAVVWVGPVLTEAVVLAEMTRRLSAHRLLRFVPAATTLGVAFVYSFHPHLPELRWGPAVVLAGGLVVIAAVAAVVVPRMLGQESDPERRRASDPGRTWQRTAVGVVAVGTLVAGILVLTVAPIEPHPHLADTVSYPAPAYDSTMGSNDQSALDWYRVTARLPTFIKTPARSNDQLLMWYRSSGAHELIGPIGDYHGSYNSILGGYPSLTPLGLNKIRSRHPGQILLMSPTGHGFLTAFQSLKRFHPRTSQRGVIASGSAKLHVELITLLWHRQGHG